MIFTILVAFSALFVAGCAAFFSIKGLIVLFSGSALAIGIMASSLEIGKLVAASFLHTHWHRINYLLKTYLCVAVFVLMCITSLGIFGFLTGAYQVHSAKVGTFDTQIAALASEKATIEAEILEYANRVKTLTDLRTTQEERLQAAGNLKAPREQAYKAIAEANQEIQKKEAEMSQGRQRSIAIEKELSTLKISLNTTTDIGSFKFIADALHTSVDTAVQYFIFLLIFVFDPLAVTLVLAWNNLVEYRKVLKRQEEEEYLANLRNVSVSAVIDSVAPASVSAPIVVASSAPVSPAVELADMAVQKDVHVHVLAQDEVESAAVKIEEVLTLPSIAPASIEPAIEVAQPISATAPVVFATDFENDPNFLKLTEEQKNIERARRRVKTGNNDSVVTA